ARSRTRSAAGSRALAALLALVVTVGSGVWPAWKSAGVDVNGTLKLGSGSVTTSSKRVAGELLATTEVAVATVLLVAAGLLVGSFVRLSTADWGFNPEHLLVATVVPPAGTMRTREAAGAWIERMQGSVRTIPHVESAAVADGFPIKYSYTPSVVRADERFVMNAEQWIIGPDYFRTLGMPVIAGQRWTTRPANAYPQSVEASRTGCGPDSRRSAAGLRSAPCAWCTESCRRISRPDGGVGTHRSSPTHRWSILLPCGLSASCQTSERLGST
ncbi:MAG TPA: hypothetical protein VGL62_04845, partial [Vicinamibacterales bacterium]